VETQRIISSCAEKKRKNGKKVERSEGLLSPRTGLRERRKEGDSPLFRKRKVRQNRRRGGENKGRARFLLPADAKQKEESFLNSIKKGLEREERRSLPFSSHRKMGKER